MLLHEKIYDPDHRNLLYRCESVGITDIRVFAECLQANTTLTELDFSRNDISDKLGLAKGLAESLKVRF